MTGPALPRPFRIALGFVVWSSAFLALYAVQALGCAFDWPDLAHRGALLALFAAHLGAVLALLRQARSRPPTHFLDVVAHWTLWAALVSTVLSYGPALALDACAAR